MNKLILTLSNESYIYPVLFFEKKDDSTFFVKVKSKTYAKYIFSNKAVTACDMEIVNGIYEMLVTVSDVCEFSCGVKKKKEISVLMKQYLELKKKHPDALLLFRCGDYYETYKKDAEDAAKILGITLTKSSRRFDDEGKPLAMAGFPYHALDIYLPKLIRAGKKVAICDQIETNNKTTSKLS